MNIWLTSNIRFFKAFLALNSLKVVSNIIGISFFAIFWMLHLNENIFLNPQYLVLLSILMVTCVSYNLIQRQTIGYRLKEIFIWKWFGIKKKGLFWLLFMEHAITILFSGIISVVLYDSFFRSITIGPVLSIESEYGILLPIGISVFFLITCGLWQIFRLLQLGKKEIFSKISFQIKDNF